MARHWHEDGGRGSWEIRLYIDKENPNPSTEVASFSGGEGSSARRGTATLSTLTEPGLYYAKLWAKVHVSSGGYRDAWLNYQLYIVILIEFNNG